MLSVAYADLLASARHTAAAICQSGRSGVLASRARFIAQQAAGLLAPTSHESEHSSENIATEWLQLLLVHWPRVCAGAVTGEDIIRSRPHLWRQLMTDWPMGAYATIAADFLAPLVSDPDLRVLEVGAGVGATTRLIEPHVRAEFCRTDRSPAVMRYHRTSLEAAEYDFDGPGRWRDRDVIFCVNALHCARDKQRTLRFLHEMLKPGGLLLISEGEPYTTSTTPWALTFLFGLFDGWWDAGGFRTRKEWQADLESTGYHRIGIRRLVAGEHDLGGLIWGIRAD